MGEIKKREFELLDSICKHNNVPTRLAKELLKSAQKNSYENVSQGARLTEYENLIKFFIKDNVGDQNDI